MFVFVSPRSGLIQAMFAHWCDAVKFRDECPQHQQLNLIDDPGLDASAAKLLGPPIEPYGESPTVPR